MALGMKTRERIISGNAKARSLVLGAVGVSALVTKENSKVSILEEWEADGAKWQV